MITTMESFLSQLVLNVDDNEAARYTKSRLLKRAGFNVVEAATGTDALNIVKASAPDLVLLDVQLPDINGFEVCQLIKKDPATRNVLVLQTSASYVAIADKIRALEEGADNYLFEPIEPEELIANVKALLRLARAERELREVNKRKDEFIAMLAHELRNPLGPIRSSVELLRRIEPDPPELRKNAREMIGRHTDHMVRLVNDLLDVSRISQGKIVLQKEPMQLDAFVEQAIDNVSSVMEERRHCLRKDLPEKDIWVFGDGVRLVQIVSNLLHNAAKFTANGGDIRISAELSEGWLDLRITDNGVGIPSDKVDMIFDLFSQAHPASDGGQGGLGIGLSLVKKLAELHGGGVSVTSEGKGKGSTFSLRLPTIEAPASPAAEPSDRFAEHARETTKIGGRVLVVDDNIDAAEILRLLLEISGYSVASSHTAGDALEKIQQQMPEIVILDIGLPDMNGRELAKQIRHIPGMEKSLLVALSGFGQQRDIEESLNAGLDAHLTKPVSQAELLRTLQNTNYKT